MMVMFQFTYLVSTLVADYPSEVEQRTTISSEINKQVDANLRYSTLNIPDNSLSFILHILQINCP